MPTRLLHLVDEAAHEDELRLLMLLLEALPRERVEQHVVVMGKWPAVLRIPPDVGVARTRRPTGTLMLGDLDPYPSRELRRLEPDLVYSWGGLAVGARILQRVRAAVVSIVGDPGDARRNARWRTAVEPSLGERVMQVVCLNGTVQRRLVEAGVPIEATAVVRPGVDFGAIRRDDRERLRTEMGLAAEGRVLLAPSPPSRRGGQYYAVWAAAILYQIWREVRLVIPGTSREQARLRRFTSAIYCPEIYHFTGDRYSPAELLAASDMVVAAAVDDVPTGWLAWAMAAGVPIVGSAVPAIAELIADGQSGLLCKPGEPHTLATRIRQGFESPGLLARCTETARGQAFETCGSQRCVDEHLRIMDNVLAGRPLGASLAPRPMPG